MIAINLFEAATKVGKKIKTSKRLHEIVENEKSITLGELSKWSKDLNCNGEDLVNNKHTVVHNDDLSIMDKQIQILRGALQCTEEINV